MLSGAVKASCLACVVITASASAAIADDPTASSTGAPTGLIEQVEEDATRAADKAAEVGESVGESAERAATTVAGEAEDIFERAKQGGRKAYEWSKQQLEKIF